MWSKIKFIAIPISVRLTLLYVSILFCILLFTSAMTVIGLYYILYSQAEEDLRTSAGNVAAYLVNGKPIDERLLEDNLLVPGVILRIKDSQNRLLIDSAPQAKSRLKHEEEPKSGDLNLLKSFAPKKKLLQLIHVDDHYFFRITQPMQQNGTEYQLHFLKSMSEQVHFFAKLFKSLLVTHVIGLLIAVAAGVYISRKALRPLSDMTHIAKEIEINDLSKRIPVTGSNDELQELAKTFNHMLSRLQAGFEQQRRFVADASHELRTPITVISGYADMLDRWGKQDESALNEGISAIKAEAANMHELIKKLLFLARSDQHKHVINKVPLPMEPLIAEIFHETQMIAPAHQVVLEWNDAATIHADPVYIKEMLRVFIENSIKYTPAGGSIRLASRKAGRFLTLSVSDTGIGVPEADQTKVFDRFYRVDKSRSKTTGGAGLGLAIAGWIAEQHDSTVQLTSASGMGTTVVVQLQRLNADAT